MTEQESKNLIKETFENDFNRERFKRFTANLLTEFQEVSILTGEQYIKDAYKPYIHSYEVIAKFTDSEKRTLDVLITYLKTESTFTARTRQRNFALDYLKSKNRDGVLIAYVHENKKDWRFSFVKLENDVVKGEDGRVKDISSFTAAKRSSFLVGSNENSYTAKKQFLPIIQREDQPKFEDIEEAFSVETVTKEFFNKYRELFHDVHDALEKEIKRKPQLKEEFDKKEVSTVDFAKKLLGQMVFLYFLQKKGWFGVRAKEEWGTGPKNFLRELFKAKDKYGKNFFNDVLEPLFYEALAQDRGRDSIYPRLNNCRMPFLNGGLFEPMRGYSWETTDIFLPDELFSNKNKDGEDIGDGILDVFDRYNFTVNESDPLEKEVAVDPEMLGKVFENLLDVKDRKSKGSFYTPREIVHYMCQECLINYLETETKGEVPREDIENLVLNGETIIQNDFVTLKKQREKEEKGYKYSGTYELKLPESIQKNARRIDNLLKNIKVCDPAVGSGAFPLGMINEIVGARQVLQVYLRDKLSVYDLKYHAIANSIHGVDIDPGAVDIARLRLWLSLIVEEKDPRPLPNLEHRIMQGNSLLSEYEGIQLFNRELLTKSSDEKFVQLGFVFGSGIKRKMEELERNIKIYVDTSQRSVKEKLKESIDELRWELIEETLKEQGKLDKIEEIKRFREKSVRPFFVWELEFSEVFKEKGGFDIVIGNPPYIQLQKDKGSLAKLFKNVGFETFESGGDIYVLFYEKGINVLRQNGVLCFITSNKWMKTKYGEKLREFFIKFNPKILIDLGPHVFDTAEVDTNILIIKKESNKGLLEGLLLKEVQGDDIHRLLKNEKIVLQNLSSAPWFISSKLGYELKNKIDNVGIPLRSWEVSTFRGILTGYNKAFIINAVKRDEILSDCQSEKERILTKEIIKPVLGGSSLSQFAHKPIDQWIINTHNGYTTQEGEYIEPIDIKDFPAIRNWLDEHKKEVYKRGDKGKTPYNLRNCAYLEEFNKNKVVWLNLNRKWKFSFVKPGIYCEASLNFLSSEKYAKVLTGILSSNVILWYFKQIGRMHDRGGYMCKIDTFRAMPIPKMSTQNERIFSDIEKIVDNILEKSRDGEENIESDLVNQINKLCYELYGLSEREILLIEDQCRNK
ncbi:MAG: Eco57I restriction-modification methylase domain-containing protein [Candidatus Dojkabacteria bacterium]